MNIAVILAAGTGKRMGGGLPKQFLELQGKTLLERSVEAFAANEAIDGIAVVTHADYIDKVRDLMKNYPKVQQVLVGGKERSDSSLAAIRAYSDKAGAEDNLIFHDAARCLVSQNIIRKVCEALKTHEAVAVAVPVTDTLFETAPGTFSGEHASSLADIPDRTLFLKAQTPQAFRFRLIREAHLKAAQDAAFMPTDDCSIVMRYAQETTICLVEGEEANIKITHPQDLYLAEKLLSL